MNTPPHYPAFWTPPFRSYLKMVYKELPPTANHIYIRGSILKAPARAYAENFAKFVAQNYLAEISEMNQSGIFCLVLRFFFPTVVNDTWMNPKVPPSKRAKTRYKRFDLTNRIKFLEDCVRDALDIDDSQTFIAHQEKFQDAENPRVEIEVFEVDPAKFGI